MSKNLDANKKHFKSVKLLTSSIDPESERILEDSTFGDITFEEFHGWNINKISSNAFNKTADKILVFECFECSLVNQPPKYDIEKLTNSMNNLLIVSLELNVTEIPANVTGQHANRSLISLYIKSHQNLTIKSNAFEFDDLSFLKFYETRIKRIERNAFKFRGSYIPYITFGNCKLTGKSRYNYYFVIKL